MTDNINLDNVRKAWRDELVDKLRNLVKPAKVLQELIKDHPDKSFLKEDVIQVLRGNDGARSYISGKVGLELSRLFELLRLSRDVDNNDNNDKTGDMFVRPVEPSNCKCVSLYGKSIEVIRLPKYMHQDNTDKFSVAIVAVHDMSKPPYSYKVSPRRNSFQAYGSINDTPEVKHQIREDFWNSFTILYAKEFRNGEITRLEEPFIPILDKLSDAIKNGDTYFDFNEHVDTQ